MSPHSWKPHLALSVKIPLSACASCETTTQPYRSLLSHPNTEIDLELAHLSISILTAAVHRLRRCRFSRNSIPHQRPPRSAFWLSRYLWSKEILKPPSLPVRTTSEIKRSSCLLARDVQLRVFPPAGPRTGSERVVRTMVKQMDRKCMRPLKRPENESDSVTVVV